LGNDVMLLSKVVLIVSAAGWLRQDQTESGNFRGASKAP
jgi:hypothetical protein